MQTFDLPSLEALPVQGPDAGLAPPSVPTVDLAAERAAAHAEGLAQAAAQLAPAVEALRAAARALEEERARVAQAVEDQAVELGLRIAEQALAGALEVRPQLVVDVVRGGLRRLVDRERVTVLVHPDDLDLVREAAPALVAELGGIEHCEVQAERRMTRGGAVVRTTEGEVDATLVTKLSRVREVVAEALAPAP